MFIIIQTIYENNEPTDISYVGKPIYDSYKSAKTDIDEMVLEYMPDYANDYHTFDMIPGATYDARILDVYGNPLITFTTYELKRPKLDELRM